MLRATSASCAQLWTSLMTDKMPVEIGLRLTSLLSSNSRRRREIRIHQCWNSFPQGNTSYTMEPSICLHIPAYDTPPKPHGKHIHHSLGFNSRIAVIPFREVPILLKAWSLKVWEADKINADHVRAQSGNLARFLPLNSFWPCQIWSAKRHQLTKERRNIDLWDVRFFVWFLLLIGTCERMAPPFGANDISMDLEYGLAVCIG